VPELPEVETVARQLARHLEGRTITRVHTHVDSLRRPLQGGKLRADVEGRTILRIGRRGKYLVVELSDDARLMLHLGMTGTFRILSRSQPRGKHEHVVFSLADGEQWRFFDPRRFGMVESFAPGQDDWPPPSLAGLGPEPLGPDFHGDYLHQCIRGHRQAIKVLLLDQRLVAGIGNIYASELLFRAGIRPGRGGRRLTRPACARVVCATREVLTEAIAAGGTTISTYTNVDGEMGMFDRELLVYGRGGEPCLVCGHPVRQRVQAGRSTYFCPRCQK